MSIVIAAADPIPPAFLLILCFFSVVAVALAVRVGLFRRPSTLGPSRLLADDSPITLLYITVAAGTLWLGVSLLYGSYLQIARGPQVVVEPANPPSVVLATRPVSTQPATTRFVTAPKNPPPPETAAVGSPDILFLSIAPPLLGLIPLIALNLLLMPRGARTLGFQWSNLQRGLFLGIIGILITMPLVLWSSMLVELLYQLFHYQTPTAHELLLVLNHAGPLTRVLVVLAAVLIAPIFEEFLFRGHLQTLLRRIFEPKETQPLPVLPAGREEAAAGELIPDYFNPASHIQKPKSIFQNHPAYPAWIAIVITSLLFASVHPAWMAPPIFVLSLCLGYSYERTGNLYVPITMHALFNTLSTLQYLLMHHG
jgi:membrane protease YdiL (CAAX protease family)